MAPYHEDIHLPALKIAGFRGIEDLSISKLGRVTLVAGKNGVGKTTLLEAIQVYAARGRYGVLDSVLREREELLDETDEEGRNRKDINWAALFYGRQISPSSRIVIGLHDLEHQVRIEPIHDEQQLQSYLDSEDLFRFIESENDLDEDIHFFRVQFQRRSHIFPALGAVPNRMLLRRSESDMPPIVECNSFGPGLLSSSGMARFWDGVALTYDEELAVEALNLIDSRVERVAMIGQEARTTRPALGRRAIVRMAGIDTPVPLKSLGDGAARVFGTALALANSRGGFLVIDEAENGIHHSVQHNYWTMVLRTAYRNNVQVVAATHSWDCVRGFAQAATEVEEVDGVLVRLESHDDLIRAVEYSEDDLRIVAEQGIEVR